MPELDSDAVDRGINEYLAKRNEELEQELKDVRAILGRPLDVSIKAPEESTLRKIGEYLPQLTIMATNLSHVASAIQMSNAVAEETNKLLARIARALEPREES